jgi:uncharacterized protein
MLVADLKPQAINPYEDTISDIMGAALRMARLYYDRYPWTLDWSNVHAKTALNIASLRGNEELVRVCIVLELNLIRIKLIGWADAM